MLFFIAYFGLFVVGIVELRHAVREGHGGKVRLLAIAVVCHLLLALSYVGKVELVRVALAAVIG